MFRRGHRAYENSYPRRTYFGRGCAFAILGGPESALSLSASTSRAATFERDLTRIHREAHNKQVAGDAAEPSPIDLQLHVEDVNGNSFEYTLAPAFSVGAVGR